MSHPVSEDLFLEDFELGYTVENRHVITDDIVHSFCALTGDYSPLHVDDEFAKASRFGRRLVHGMLTSAYITEIIGMKLPGRNGIYMNQSLAFRKPVYIGDEVTIRAEIMGIDQEKSRIRLATTCLARNETVVDGEALIFVPKRAN